MSEAITNGVRVQVSSRFLEERSNPSVNKFIFAYTVTITNLEAAPVQLMSRKWIIKDADGDIETVEGAGVVGESLLLAQFAVGWILWFQGMGSVLPRAWIHILYGVVAIITLPAAYLYFSKIQDPKVQTIAMAVACAFLWGIVLRSAQVVFIPVS